MAELVLSALLSVLFEKLADAAVKQIARYDGIDADINKWTTWLTLIQDVLTDASQKEIASQPVKRWLNNLQHLAYDIDDVLDELATEAMHRQSTDQSETHISKVRKLIPSYRKSSQSSRMHAKLDKISANFKDLIEQKGALGLTIEEEPRSRNASSRKNQTSIVHTSSIIGRQGEKEEYVQMLLGGGSCDQNFSIVPIVGMGGVGKTTLARLLYDEEQVREHFKLKAWVCVSDDFDTFAISKVIFQSVTGKNKNFADLNLLQEALRDQLLEKKFLLVLDDVWSESLDEWETLVGPFYACGPGSKIIMTTRKDKLLRELHCNHLNQLQSLSHDDALSLLALNAFGVKSFDSHLSLKPHGVAIVKKCKGLPLALKALGRLLSTKSYNKYSWKKVLDSEIWNLAVEGQIIPALILSYHDLAAHLKQFFAYCSLFPKDFLFNKEDLVLLWMAEGFLRNSSTKESLGCEYFDELLSRSFFQHAPTKKSMFIMHDMMSDLATYVAGDFHFRLDTKEKKDAEKDIGNEMLEKHRHMSFVRNRFVTCHKFERFKKATRLRTFLATSVKEVESWRGFYLSNKVIDDLLGELPMLRVLSLSSYKINEVPKSIGTLRHLRYLNLSQTSIIDLPENVCNLYNLQTLLLASCKHLAKLPTSFSKLKNLRHLDIRDTPCLDHMPSGIVELKNLETLSKIVMGGLNGIEMSSIKDLQQLCGTVSIVGLEKVQNAIHVREAKFSRKRLSKLEVIWNVSDGSQNEMLEEEVLNELKPHYEYLKHLKIQLYMGLDFPKWVGHHSFLHLKHVSLLGCKNCTSLPPLGQLPSLKELFVEGLDEVKDVGLELLGTSHAFKSLELLSFVNMPMCEKWSTNIGDVFPCLQKLLIKDCPNLSEVSLGALPSLNVLDIKRCDSGVLRSLVHLASIVTKLDIESISGLNDVVWKGVIEHLEALEVLIIRKCNEIRCLWKLEASMVLANLRKLEVFDCDNMEHCSCPDSIDTFRVWSCTSVTSISFPMKGNKLKSLRINDCNELLETKWAGSNMPKLESVWLGRWPSLISVTELKYLVHLTSLTISGCESLESFPYNELSSMTSLKTLEIRDCPKIDICGNWPPKLRTLGLGRLKKPISEWGPQNFPPSLVDLWLYDNEDGVSNFDHLSHLLPSSLTSLHIVEFKKLESASTGLQHLTSLKHLAVLYCPIMKHLPRMLFPSLLSLTLHGCPNLNERCKAGGSYWHHISHIPMIRIHPLTHL